jgi:hypothetical protein
VAPAPVLADRLVSARHAVAALIITASLMAPTAAYAQRACEARGLDAFASARRARRIVADYRFLQQRSEDVGALNIARYEYTAIPGLYKDAPIFIIPVMDYTAWPSLTACREGTPRDASLSSLRYGLIAGFKLRDPGLRLDVFAIRSDDSISITGDAPQEISQDQTLFGARAQWRRWASLTAGLIEDDREDALGAVPRLYMALGVPALNLQTDVILDRRDQSLQTLYVDLDRLPLSDALALSARAAYLEDERQLVTTAGLYLPLFRRARAHVDKQSSYRDKDGQQLDMISLYPELGVEWDGVNIRHARLRATLDSISNLAIESSGEITVNWNVFTELSLFRSHLFEERTGISNAFGASVGGRLVVGVTQLMSFIVDSSISINRPETLAQVSELAHAREYRLQFYWYIPLALELEDHDD